MNEIHKQIERWVARIDDTTSGGYMGVCLKLADDMRAWLKSPAADFVAVPREKIEALQRWCDQFGEPLIWPPYLDVIKPIIACAEPPPKKDENWSGLAEVYECCAAMYVDGSPKNLDLRGKAINVRQEHGLPPGKPWHEIERRVHDSIRDALNPPQPKKDEILEALKLIYDGSDIDSMTPSRLRTIAAQAIAARERELEARK